MYLKTPQADAKFRRVNMLWPGTTGFEPVLRRERAAVDGKLLKLRHTNGYQKRSR
jgi:hypothetical protein